MRFPKWSKRVERNLVNKDEIERMELDLVEVLDRSKGVNLELKLRGQRMMGQR